MHPADHAEHILLLDIRADIRRGGGVHGLEFAARYLADQIKNMRMVTQRAAAEPSVPFPQRYTFAVALFGYALPWERPDRGQRGVGRLEGQEIPQLSGCDKLLHAAHDRIVVQLQLDLTDHTLLFTEPDHLVVFVHVEGGDLHGEDVDAAVRAQPHLPQMFAVFTGKHHSLDLRMRVEHLLIRVIAGNPVHGI